MHFTHFKRNNLITFPPVVLQWECFQQGYFKCLAHPTRSTVSANQTSLDFRDIICLKSEESLSAISIFIRNENNRFCVFLYSLKTSYVWHKKDEKNPQNGDTLSYCVNAGFEVNSLKTWAEFLSVSCCPVLSLRLWSRCFKVATCSAGAMRWCLTCHNPKKRWVTEDEKSRVEKSRRADGFKKREFWINT